MKRTLCRALAALCLTATITTTVTALADDLLTPADTTWGAPTTTGDTTWGTPAPAAGPADTATVTVAAVPLDTTWG
ncbi:hypothetical protein [Streptomyces sp. NPDC001658]